MSPREDRAEESGAPARAADAAPTGRSPRDIAAALNAARAGAPGDEAAAAPGAGPPAPPPLDDVAHAVARRIDDARSGPEADADEEEEFDATDDYVAPPPLREMARARSGVAELLLFRVGRELFATGLADVEEAVERSAVHPLPHMPPAMLGVFELRGSLVPVYSPGAALGVPLGEGAGTLVMSGGGRRVAIAVDEVSDVVQLDISTLRDAPASADPDGILLGVARRGAELVSVVDGEALV
ncbi:MAG TPA: chemotaxis protein CheW, partial [Gemmatimonadaceae bacterium]|nr:chemotaxis protein CheW [Gemmatimonadaceae bacterium]